MKVFKFGGASVKNAEAIKNVGSILLRYERDPIVIIVSAMGKTTNKLEEVLSHWVSKNELKFNHTVDELRDFHNEIAGALFHARHHKVFNFIDERFESLKNRFDRPLAEHLPFEYDQIVSLGEVLSSFIISEYLVELGLRARWVDARTLVRTDNRYQEGNVQWEKTEQLITQCLPGADKETDKWVTQGFVGHTAEGFTTTLGREGSDYSAAIFAYCLNAEAVTIWKDVPGMLNADPKYFENTRLLTAISYREAIELAYFGASVIHPKTIKPLQNKGIPLYVKSFVHPEEPGTVIHAEGSKDHLIPSFIVKKNQCLLSISATDFSFINEESLSKLFEVFYAFRVTVQLMQNSALNFSTLIDPQKVDVHELIQALSPAFTCKYNLDVELVTIRHYDEDTIEQVLAGREVLLEQRSRQTARFVIR